MRRAFAAVVLVGTIAAPPVLPADAAAAQTDARVTADSLFRAGRALIGAKDYRDAAALLQDVVIEFPKAEQAPAALYWRAWALDAAGLAAHDTVRLRAALVTISGLETRYPAAPIAADARWLRADIVDDEASLGDAVAKEAMTAATARVLKAGVSCDRPDLELELVAVERHVSLYLSKMPELAETLLATQGACARDAKLATITALAGAPTPTSVRMLMAVARDPSDTGLRADALHALQTINTRETALFLDSIARARTNEVVPAPQATALDASRATKIERDFAELRKRPLTLPAIAPGQPCPRERPRMVYKPYGLAIGKGPAFAAGFGTDGVIALANAPGSAWGGQKVVWFFDPAIRGPILIRGGSLDGKGQLRFDTGVETEIAIEPDEPNRVAPPSRPSTARVSGPGCYAFQIDGTGFSETIVFEAMP